MTLLLHIWQTFPHAYGIVVLFIIKMVIDCWPRAKSKAMPSEGSVSQVTVPSVAPDADPLRSKTIVHSVRFVLRETGYVLLVIFGLPLLVLLMGVSMILFGTDIVSVVLSRLPSKRV